MIKYLYNNKNKSHLTNKWLDILPTYIFDGETVFFLFHAIMQILIQKGKMF